MRRAPNRVAGTHRRTRDIVTRRPRTEGETAPCGGNVRRVHLMRTGMSGIATGAARV